MLGRAMGTIDKRRFQRFEYDGAVMLVFIGHDSMRTLAITSCRDVSQGGACILTPAADDVGGGDHIFLMPERYRRKREAVVVDCEGGRLHLDLARSQYLSEFEVAELLQVLEARASR